MKGLIKLVLIEALNIMSVQMFIFKALMELFILIFELNLGVYFDFDIFIYLEANH